MQQETDRESERRLIKKNALTSASRSSVFVLSFFLSPRLQ